MLYILPTSVSHGQSLHHQSRVGQLILLHAGRVCRGEVHVVGEGAVRRRRARVWPLALGLRRPRSPCEREVRGVLGLGGRRGTVPLPRLHVLQLAAGALPVAQGAGDGVRDVRLPGGVVRRRGRRGPEARGSRAAPLRSRRARHPHPSALLLLVSVLGPVLQDELQVAPEATLGAVVIARGKLGNLERGIWLPITAPLNGLQFATYAVHGVVASTRLGCAVVHTDGRAAGLASWLEKLKSDHRKHLAY